VAIEDEAFIGHGVMFINDRYPRSATPEGGLQTVNVSPEGERDGHTMG